MDVTPTLSIAAELENLALIRHFVEKVALAFEVEENTIIKVQLAVDEAATNIIIHGYQGQKGNIDIEMGREGADLRVFLRDEAAPFDPTLVPSPDVTLQLEQRIPGGLGIYLMRQTMDEMIYHPTPGGGNELVLVKRGICGK